MGIVSTILLAVFLVILGSFLLWPTAVAAAFVGVSAFIEAGVILIENLWPHVRGTRVVNT
jgi:hypothetical protein